MDSSKKNAEEDSSSPKNVDKASVAAPSPSKKRRLLGNADTARLHQNFQPTTSDVTAKLHQQPGAIKSRLLSNADMHKLRQNSEPSTSRKQELVCSCTKASDKGVKGCFSCSICGKVQHKICQTFMPLSLCNGCHARKIGVVSRKQTSELKHLPVKKRSTNFVSEKKIEVDCTDKLSRRVECLELQVTKIRKDQVSYELVIWNKLAQIEADLKLIFEWILKKKK